MATTENKQDLIKEFSGIKYILTSGMRSKLLLAIYDDPKNLDELRKELKKPSATILHGLKELETTNLVKKVQKYYELTSNGYLITTNLIKLIENWYAVNKNKQFWNNHDLSGIPTDALKNMYLLKDAQYIQSTTSDLSNAFNSYLKLISKAKTLKILLPIYSENHFKYLIKIINNEHLKSLELIINEKLEKSIAQNEDFKKSILEHEKVKVKVIQREINLFLTYSHDFISLTLFFKDGHYDDSEILISKEDENALKWAKIIRRFY